MFKFSPTGGSSVAGQGGLPALQELIAPLVETGLTDAVTAAQLADIDVLLQSFKNDGQLFFNTLDRFMWHDPALLMVVMVV